MISGRRGGVLVAQSPLQGVSAARLVHQLPRSFSLLAMSWGPPAALSYEGRLLQLALPVKPRRLRQGVGLCTEVPVALGSGESVKQLEQVKATLMARFFMAEAGAYSFLRRKSMDGRLRLLQTCGYYHEILGKK